MPAIQRDEELYQLPKEELVKIIQALRIELERLKEIVNKDSKSSSKPPSQDIIKKSEKKKSEQQDSEEGEKRKPGGQPGHEGKTRKGFGRVDRIEMLRPEKCPYCGGIHFLELADKIEKQVVAQFVANPIEIVEYQRIHQQCSHCGTVSAADWSDSIVPGQDLGLRLQALIGWLGNYAHMPYEKIRELIEELGQIDIGEGTLVATNQRVAQAIEKPVKELSDWVKSEQPNIHVDETPWTVKGVKEWLWVFANRGFCLFKAADTRSRDELESILGSEYAGVLSSDDFSVYNGYAANAQQKCLAHMRRHFKNLSKSPVLHNHEIALCFIELIDDVFKNYQQFQITGSLEAYKQWAFDFKSTINKAFKEWIPQAGATALNLLTKLRDKYDQWWYCLDHPEVPPDNNLAERNLRLAVTKRKISGGSRSLERFGDTANLLTVVQTCRSQGRSVIGFFANAILAHTHNQIIFPSLIPCSAT
ncbi:transposase IS66 [Calothrix sp. NIES-4101]|nr:transposase IS66 [Calothrix sp. NIES-4101]BAZ40970.1 transposase IS66 [Calothrix sp. NIES-4101]BAZ41475.1 transposase IS66 [Calothrix sp. NIES-4101]BAZ41836.1 transposase IS66 [Calothrix sp. NIES-4101]